jgi:hypothetical protein
MFVRLILAASVLTFTVSAHAQIPRVPVKKAAPTATPTPAPSPAAAATPAPAAAPKLGEEEDHATALEPDTAASKAPSGLVFDSIRFYQPGLGESAVTTGITVPVSSSIQRESKFLESKITGINPFFINYAVAISDKMAIGAELDYYAQQSADAIGTSKFSGLSEPLIYFHGLIPQNRFKIRYGAVVTLPIEEGKISDDQNSESATASEFSITPKVGTEMKLGSGICGSELTYDLRGERTYDYRGTKNSFKGGNILTATLFHEWFLSESRLGLSLSQIWVEQSEKTAPVSRPAGTAFERTSARVYGSMPLGRADLLPGLTWDFRKRG